MSCWVILSYSYHKVMIYFTMSEHTKYAHTTNWSAASKYHSSFGRIPGRFFFCLVLSLFYNFTTEDNRDLRTALQANKIQHIPVLLGNQWVLAVIDWPAPSDRRLLCLITVEVVHAPYPEKQNHIIYMILCRVAAHSSKATMDRLPSG